ncbi:right-handed parallel beta-helix repeat-containing protein [Amycolatopsis magusensis]|uniref:right-handed parallel beta-helix repeat-containing protein n=1 Tax=Amycolatopsis magusensis TaxID=882444 RepID=UPI0024A8D54E|nr:right-handed parallel beta-helix repeat-containing protein [Amycolatopsis magusensis]MDI5978169.1 right-handed parallel beta-helix repeat-containing protein [Amycolatopsis magusensis]
MRIGFRDRPAGSRVLPLALSVLLLQVSVAPAAVAVAAPGSAAEVAEGVCGTTAGVPAAPAGAEVVQPGTDLTSRTSQSPAGSTFWLAPGTHTLSPDQYGQVMPKDGNVYLGAPGAVLDGRGINRAAFTTTAKDVVIRGLTIRGFVAERDQGVVNHDSGERWIIEGNVIEENQGAALMAGAGQQVLGNCLRNNGQYGINAYRIAGGITDLVIEGNEITGNNTGDWETLIPGCGCSGGAKFWAVDGADIIGNWVHHNHGVGLWADTNNNDFLVEGNLIEDNGSEGLFYEISYNLELVGNTFRRNALVQGRNRAAKGDNFPVASVYISESGGEPRLPARTDGIVIRGNMFSENWSGITLWENADRFCNSPANTSTLSCTALVSPTSDCSAPAIASEPLYGDCRWKTQRVSVFDNTFEFDSTLEGCLGLCGRMAVLSNYGTFPAWSPYKAAVISEAVTFEQDNRWYDNKYYGPWSFVAHDTSRQLTAAQWRAAPYSQDTCSVFGAMETC